MKIEIDLSSICNLIPAETEADMRLRDKLIASFGVLCVGLNESLSKEIADSVRTRASSLRVTSGLIESLKELHGFLKAKHSDARCDENDFSARSFNFWKSSAGEKLSGQIFILFYLATQEICSYEKSTLENRIRSCIDQAVASHSNHELELLLNKQKETE